MTNSMTISNQNELSHHGILGQRWGVRRYQNPDGSLTTLGRKHVKHTEAGKRVETNEQKKERIIKSGDAKAMYENRHLFTTNEITEFNNRKTAEANLRKNIPKQTNRGKEFVDKYIEASKTMGSFLENTNKVYSQGKIFCQNYKDFKRMMSN